MTIPYESGEMRAESQLLALCPVSLPSALDDFVHIGQKEWSYDYPLPGQ